MARAGSAAGAAAGAATGSAPPNRLRTHEKKPPPAAAAGAAGVGAGAAGAAAIGEGAGAGAAIAGATGDDEDARDITQETYLRAIGALPRFAGRSTARTWLLSIARRVVVDPPAEL